MHSVPHVNEIDGAFEPQRLRRQLPADVSSFDRQQCYFFVRVFSGSDPREMGRLLQCAKRHPPNFFSPGIVFALFRPCRCFTNFRVTLFRSTNGQGSIPSSRHWRATTTQSCSPPRCRTTRGQCWTTSILRALSSTGDCIAAAADRCVLPTVDVFSFH